MEITACPKCGSRKIFQGNIGDGVLTGYTSRNVCKDCGYQGMPLIFDSDEEYEKFLEGLAKESSAETFLVTNETAEGVQFDNLGGVGGLLRFEIHE